jgi:hypothetical protein
MSPHKSAACILAVSLVLFLTAPVFAQYGSGGGAGGMGSTGTAGGYQPPKGGYSSSTGIAIGAAAAAGVGITYLALRNYGTIVGCVQPASDGLKLLNEKDRNTYALVASNVSFSPGERVALRGKKSKSDSGSPSLQVSKLVKDYGSCKQEAALR